MAQIIPLVSLILASGRIIPKIPKDYKIPPATVTEQYVNAAMIQGMLDKETNTERYSPLPSRQNHMMPKYASMVKLSDLDVAETLIFRITTKTLEDKGCTEIYVDNLPFGELGKNDSFGISGDCLGIYEAKFESRLGQLSVRRGDELNYDTFNLRNVDPRSKDFLEARLLANVKLALNELAIAYRPE